MIRLSFGHPVSIHTLAEAHYCQELSRVIIMGVRSIADGPISAQSHKRGRRSIARGIGSEVTLSANPNLEFEIEVTKVPSCCMLGCSVECRAPPSADIPRVVTSPAKCAQSPLTLLLHNRNR